MTEPGRDPPGSDGPASAMTRPLFFLLVDAIPFDVAHEVWSSGDLPGFLEPRPAVAAFPSLTEVAVPSLLRGIFPARPPGYEARYYHPPSGEVRGRPGDPISEVAMEPLRARPVGWLPLASIYLFRERLAYAQIRWITHRFQREGGPWLGYLSATDGVAHFNGRAGVVRALRDIGAQVHEVRLEHRRRHGVLPGVVLCSDHGMAFGPLAHLSASRLADRIADADFRIGENGPDGAVLVPYGNVSAGVVHADGSRSLELAEIVARAPGVGLVFAHLPDGFVVVAPGDPLRRANAQWSGDRYRYRAIEGDPLGYADVWAALERNGKLRDGWAQDRDVFAATWTHRYPDALYRVRLAFEDLVQFPAPVLFSMSDGWTYGPALTHAGARLIGRQIGTHGALAASQSLCFAAATDEGGDPWPDRAALRPEDVFRPWRERVRAAGDQ